MGKESLFQKKVIKYLESLDQCFVIKYWAGGIYTKSGIPDLLICYKGRFLAIELKAEDGIVSKLQVVQMKRIEKSGGFTMVLRPSQFEDFKEMLKDEKFNYC